MKKFFFVLITLSFFAFSCSTTDTVNNNPQEISPDVSNEDQLADFIDEIKIEVVIEEIAEEIHEEPAGSIEQEIVQQILPEDPLHNELTIADESLSESLPEETAAAEEIPEPETVEQIIQPPPVLAQPPVPLLPRAPPPQTPAPQAQPPAAQTPAIVQAPVTQTQPLAAAQTPPSQAVTPQIAQLNSAASSTPAIVQQPSAAQTVLPVTQTPPAQTLPLIQTPQIPQYTEQPEKTDPYQNEPFRNLPSAPAAGIDSRTQMGMTPQDSELIFSRIVRATVGQIVEIPFRGNNWVYLGELASRRGIVYNSRRNDPEGQSFIFTLEDAGTYVLKFYRQDFIRDYIINDHVQVIAGEAPAAAAGWFNPSVDRSRVIAEPRWPSVLEEAQIRSGVRPVTDPYVSGAAPDSTVSQNAAAQQGTAVTPVAVQPSASQTPSTVVSPNTAQSSAAAVSPNAPQSANNLQQSSAVTPSEPEGLPPNVILQRAKESFDRGNVAGAISLLNQYMQYYPGGSDEFYWLMGQFYEASSPERNILLSLDSYRRLVNEYPQSTRFADARSRIAYLERFYINIR